MSNFILYECASGYALFERVLSEDIGQELEEVQQAVLDLSKFGKMIQLKSFAPFKSASHALENMNDISEGICNDTLKSFIELNLPKSSKKSKVTLGISEKNLAGTIKETLNINCESNDIVSEFIRGIRFHQDKLLKQMKEGDIEKAQLGLGHSYSRAKVKFNVNRVDNMIIQAIALLDQMDKDINTFAMRCREWYSWHFPELAKIIPDHGQYARLAKLIKNKSNITPEITTKIEEIVGDAIKTKQVVDAANASMGTDISEIDILNIESFAQRVIDLTDYRKRLYEYLVSKMHNVAPNLSSLIGEVVGARLISHAGSLTNLSKYPASTVQILGAEKALFRALKTKGNTPKYGLIFHSSFIGRAGAKNKGRISRFLANKCSIASRVDCFMDVPTNKFGEAMKEQVEERLKFYESGEPPRRNLEVMNSVMKDISADDEEIVVEDKEKSKKRKSSDEKETKKAKKAKKEEKTEEKTEEKKEKKEKKHKKDKKEKKEKEATVEKSKAESADKKKKKKKSKN